jgi:cytochrome b
MYERKSASPIHDVLAVVVVVVVVVVIIWKPVVSSGCVYCTYFSAWPNRMSSLEEEWLGE